MDRGQSIVFITWDQPLYDLAAEAIKEHTIPCGLVLASQETIQETAKQYETRGTRIFISFGICGKFVRRAVQIPVITLDISEEDIIHALIQASAVGKRIAIIGFQKTMRRISALAPLLNIELYWRENPSIDEMETTIRQMPRADIFIGGNLQTGIAARLGMKTIVLKPRKESIFRAMDTARSFLLNNKAENKVSQTSSIYAVMTVRPDGVIEMLNNLAAECLGLHPRSPSPATIHELCPQFTKILDAIENQKTYTNQIAQIQDRYFLYHAEPVFQANHLNYVLVTFQDTESVVSSELTIRRRLSQRKNITTYSLDDILGNSHCIRETLKLALKYAGSQENVLILGQTGTGKELYAQGIHNASSRRNGPFVAVNCASIPENILESELFGYVKGAFTGAAREGKKGLFEVAHGGTIFLDEIGEIPYSLQGKLLRVLQERQIRRLGDETPIPIDIRVIAATNKNLVELVRDKEFRDDLYFRLNILNLRIPPLCQREGDPLLLAEEFLKQASVRQKRNFYFSAEAKKEILRYQWPGNVRELQNMIYRLGVINESDCIHADTLRLHMTENAALFHPYPSSTFSQPLTLQQALEQAHHNKTQAAALLGVSRATLYRMIKNTR